jgi:hypothetical protein
MKRQNRHRWLITAWFLIMGCLLTVVYGQQYGTLYKGISTTYRSAYASVPASSAPTYEFQSTSTYVESGSTYAPVVSAPFATLPGKMGGSMRKSMWDGDPDDNELGTVDDPTPVGEPWILLLLALMYLIYTVYKKKTILTK